MAYRNYTPIFVNSKFVGKVIGKTFYKVVSGSRHFLHTPPAIGFEVSSLKDAEAAGAIDVNVKDRETGTTYFALISLIFDKGFNVNRGWGDQIALHIKLWLRDGAAVQLPLF